jgi:hypothetical protein
MTPASAVAGASSKACFSSWSMVAWQKFGLPEAAALMSSARARAESGERSEIARHRAPMAEAVEGGLRNLLIKLFEGEFSGFFQGAGEEPLGELPLVLREGIDLF